jgi:ribulose-5-phosphate 4-epimerase/fuculose-1-phosphate aldolase
MLEVLKQKVCDANTELKTRNLVLYSWGNFIISRSIAFV